MLNNWFPWETFWQDLVKKTETWIWLVTSYNNLFLWKWNADKDTHCIHWKKFTVLQKQGRIARNASEYCIVYRALHVALTVLRNWWEDCSSSWIDELWPHFFLLQNLNKTERSRPHTDCDKKTECSHAPSHVFWRVNLALTLSFRFGRENLPLMWS